MEELIKELNEEKITQTSLEWVEGLSEERLDSIFGAEEQYYEPIASGLDVDKRRWYETGMSVYPIKGGYLGVRHIQDLFSEQSMASDIGWVLQFFEMEKYMVVTYKEKR